MLVVLSQTSSDNAVIIKLVGQVKEKQVGSVFMLFVGVI